MGLTAQAWSTLKEASRRCNALAGPPEDPDLVVFTGWEWTQMGHTPDDHYGHKNVIFRDTDDASLPARPISAARGALVETAEGSSGLLLGMSVLAPHHAGIYLTYRRHLLDILEMKPCPEGVDVHELPLDCYEQASDAGTLFEKLGQWGFDALVIPHGNTWGLHVPALASWDNQLTPRHHDPRFQRLIEIHSGHGNSEEYRPWRAHDASGGTLSCPPPSTDFLPCCWRAGELVRARCPDPASARCDEEVRAARHAYLEAGLDGWRTVPEAEPADWLDCGQCRDCFQPAFNLRPAASVQYALATANLEGDDPLRYRFGILGSSDNHKAQPGTGYKEKRKAYTDSSGETNGVLLSIFRRERRKGTIRGAAAWEIERQGSFWYTGGLAAVHATDRSREAIWDALTRRQVYGTSGERILLWFDLVNGPDGRSLPMGSEAYLAGPPRFEVRAVGAFAQEAGCPEETRAAVGDELLEQVCLGECYHPTDTRHLIDRIEVVRIRPRRDPHEPVDGLIEDPWKVLPCVPDPAGCRVRFEDPSFGERSALYYVRAIQEDGMAVNAGNLRCRFDEDGTCTAVEPCYASYLTPADDDCLAPSAARAWSSPIFVEPARAGS